MWNAPPFIYLFCIYLFIYFYFLFDLIKLHYYINSVTVIIITIIIINIIIIMYFILCNFHYCTSFQLLMAVSGCCGWDLIDKIMLNQFKILYLNASCTALPFLNKKYV